MDSNGQAAGAPGQAADQARTTTAELAAIEAEIDRLGAELDTVEDRLVSLGRSLCPDCRGTGQCRVRGGLYGEVQRQPCPCRNAFAPGGE